MLLQMPSCFRFCFEDTDISHGSVATHLRYCEIFSDNVITKFSRLIQRNKFENQSVFYKVKAYQVKACKKVCQFFGHLLIADLC